MARAFLFVLDSLGIGGAPDADAYGDLGSDTFGHIAEFCAGGAADRRDLRQGPLTIPNMAGLGLIHAHQLSSGRVASGFTLQPKTWGAWAAANEISRGKDTPSGHWEIAGAPVTFDWGYFPDEAEAFPKDLVAKICQAGNIAGILGNCHASGTDVIARFGEEHIRSGKPICYTSSDSVFQIAAHEKYFGLEHLIGLCQKVRALLDPLNIGRVIARPFIGENAATFMRTGNRRDFSVLPPQRTLLDRLVEAGRKVHAIGKIGDIFAHQGISRVIKANGNMALFDASLKAMDEAQDGDLVFTNFVDFDMLYGHRRDVAGYAGALEAFDRRLPQVAKKLQAGDLVVLTADHGCDPTWRGTDHTRERVPVLAFGPAIRAQSYGILDSYADIGESIARHLDIAPGLHGKSFL